MTAWKAVEGYDGIYEVSSDGVVRSLDRSETYYREDVLCVRFRCGRVINPSLRFGGDYLKTGLCKDGVPRLISTHRLVATAFVQNPMGKPQINHINGNKRDNRACNLEWVTAKENTAHAVEVGLRTSIGETHGRAILTEADVHAIRSDERILREIAANYGVQIAAIHKIKTRRTWKHLP